jgi:hypothetical protein
MAAQNPPWPHQQLPVLRNGPALSFSRTLPRVGWNLSRVILNWL